MALKIVLAVVIAYFFGAIPFGYIVSKVQGVDIMSQGSGNIGFTNVWRVMGIKSGIIVLVCDMAKGYLAAWIGLALTGANGAILAGIACILGHTFNVFLRFKGGKGVASGAGVILCLSPLTFVICVVLLSVITGITRYMSLGSIITALSCPFIMLFLGEPWQYVVGIGICCVYVVYKHKANILRLMNGTENKIGKRKDKPKESER